MPDDDFFARKPDSVNVLLTEWQRERPDIDTWPIAIFARILRLSAQMTQMTADWLKEEGLTWEAFSLIVTLRRQGAPYEMRPTEILRDSLLTSGAVTNRVDRVVALGLVVRGRDPQDRRGVVVRLTEIGVARADRAITAHAEHLSGMLGGLIPEERKALTALLQTTLAQVEALSAKSKTV